MIIALQKLSLAVNTRAMHEPLCKEGFVSCVNKGVGASHKLCEHGSRASHKLCQQCQHGGRASHKLCPLPSPLKSSLPGAFSVIVQLKSSRRLVQSSRVLLLSCWHPDTVCCPQNTEENVETAQERRRDTAARLTIAVNWYHKHLALHGATSFVGVSHTCLSWVRHNPRPHTSPQQYDIQYSK